MPDCAISMDMISGFCTETETEHNDTLNLMRQVKFDFGYMFKYSERPNTPAQKKWTDDITEEVTQKRLSEVINLQMQHSLERNQEAKGKEYQILIEGESKKSKNKLFGRTKQNKVVIIDKANHKAGDYLDVIIEDCTAATLIGRVI